MKIARITLRVADLPLNEPYRLSGVRLAFERLGCDDTDEGPSGGPQPRPVASPSKTALL